MHVTRGKSDTLGVSNRPPSRGVPIGKKERRRRREREKREKRRD